MKALVMYDSRHNTTEKIVQAVAESLRTTMQVALARIDKGDDVDLEFVDLVVIGCPTHMGDMDMESLLRFIPRDAVANKRVAIFDTIPQGWHWFGGTAASSLTRKLYHYGAMPILSPETFYITHPHEPIDKTELWRASNWARALQEQLQLLPV